MEGICCICRKSIGVGKWAAKQVVASFALSHYGLCPDCLGRTRADISRIYGPAGAGSGTVAAARTDKGLQR